MKFRRRRSPDVGIDLTPLIDVVFLLLIFFMVTTTFVRDAGLTLELPDADVEPVAVPGTPIRVTVDAAGVYGVDERVLEESSRAALEAALRSAVGEDIQVPLIIVADAAAPHAAVVRVMDVAGRIGLERVRIATRPTAEAD